MYVFLVHILIIDSTNVRYVQYIKSKIKSVRINNNNNNNKGHPITGLEDLEGE